MTACVTLMLSLCFANISRTFRVCCLAVDRYGLVLDNKWRIMNKKCRTKISPLLSIHCLAGITRTILPLLLSVKMYMYPSGPTRTSRIRSPISAKRISSPTTLPFSISSRRTSLLTSAPTNKSPQSSPREDYTHRLDFTQIANKRSMDTVVPWKFGSKHVT